MPNDPTILNESITTDPQPQPARPDAVLLAAADKLAAAAGKIADLNPADLVAAATAGKSEPVPAPVLKQVAANPEFKKRYGFSQEQLAGLSPDFVRQVAAGLGIGGASPSSPPPPAGKPSASVLKGDADRLLADIKTGVFELVEQAKRRSKEQAKEKEKKEKDRGAATGEGEGGGLLGKLLGLAGRRGGRLGGIVAESVGKGQEAHGLIGSLAGRGAGAAGGAAGAEGAAGIAAAAGPVGIGVAVVVAATAALVELAKAGRDAAYSQEQFNRHLAEFSPSQGAIAGQMDARRAMRSLQMGEDTAGSSATLTASIDKLEQAMQPVERLGNDVANLVGAGIVDILADLAQAASDLVVAAEKHIPGLKDILKRDERGGAQSFGSFMAETAEAEDRKAAARRADRDASRRFAGDF